MAEKNKPNELYITRVYDAPVKMVWEAWTDPKQVAQWWGPRGFTLTTHSKDLKVGGYWKYTMHGPDGVDWPNNTIYHEVEKYSRLVYDHGGNDDQPPMFRVTVNFFEEKGGRTRMEMTMALATAEAATETHKFIRKAGGDSTWDRLAEYLAAESTKEDIFVITRTFEAPLNTVFDVFTGPQHVAKWLPPTGFDMQYLKADIRAGETSFYVMSGADGMKMYGKANYREITKPNKIVYTQIFCDENENITRHPAAPTWPETMLTTILFEAEGPAKTRVCIRWEVVGDATAAERETFHKAKAGMTQGWSGSFEKLENYLAGLG